ncbi:MAG TPA: DUF4031 domain-containing protein [Trueperaceae bacterium]
MNSKRGRRSSGIEDWRKGKRCHMVSDSGDLIELREMAARIGMRRSWFQRGGPGETPHYDLRPSKRALAVAAGAKEITFRELGEIILAEREEGKGKSVEREGL